MTAPAVLAGALMGAALLLSRPRRPRPAELLAAPAPPPGPASAPGPVRRFRPAWCALAVLAGATLLGGPTGWVAGGVAGAGLWVLVGREEGAEERRRREEVARDLPHVVGLLADAVRAGADPAVACRLVVDALPGPAAERLDLLTRPLGLGGDPAVTWQRLEQEPGLAPLGRALARAHASGAPVAAAVAGLAEELARDARASAEDRARAVGVKAAVPLGLCLLPAFVVLGIVPVVAGLVGGLL